jgi:hypothetical protein
VHLFDRSPLLARLASLGPEPACQFVCEGVELAGADALGIARLDRIGPKVLLDGVARQAGTARYLAQGQMLSVPNA